MSKIEPASKPDIGFDVEINSGGRAYDASATSEGVRAVSPTRLAAKEQARRRRVIIISLLAVGVAAVALWGWLSNPNTSVPSDAVARVNGEYILEKDVDREINLTKASLELSQVLSGTNGVDTKTTLPSRAQVLEDLITRKMQVQDARKAGVVVGDTDIESAVQAIMERTGVSQEKLEAALAKYGLTLDDLREITGDVALINKYIGDYVASGAKDEQDVQNKRNDWLTSLAQTSKIDRLKASGAGPAPQIGKEAPDFTLTSLDGKEVKLSDLRGKPVLVNFWATWCPPCRAEIPEIVQTYKETHKDNYEIVGIATQSDRPTIEAFAKEFGILFPVLPDADNRITSDLYHVIPIPTSFFIDKDGIIRDIHIGPVDRTLLEKWLLTSD